MTKMGERLKLLRLQKKVTQKEIADYLGIAANSVQRFEYDQTNPSYENLIKLCEYFNVSTDYLLTGEEDVPVQHDFRETISGRIAALSAKSKQDLEEYLVFLESRDNPKRS